MINLVCSQILRVTEQVSEAHDGVLSILDQMRLGSVTDVLSVSFMPL